MKASYKALFLGFCMASSAIVVPTIASAGVLVDIDVAPPPVRVETVPGPRAGYVWAPGYWEWSGHEHVWRRGRWMHERHDQHWVPDHWVQAGPHWHHERGHWER
jgi:WXXGXW repeat (2 copies)